VRVLEAKVTFRWLGQFEHIDQQQVPVNKFIRDFIIERSTQYG
jgi:hypothetical protein